MMIKIIGESPAIRELLALIEKVGPTKTNILIVGESGTGKELVAQMIHEMGILKLKPFVAINCGAIPENLLESELFGHKRGSFTGAIMDKIGLFEMASGGTLFLDEVGDLPMSMQVKILRAIQDRVIRRVGGLENIKIDVRIIAATNKNLEAGIIEGSFREDLYYRLNVIQIRTPPLRNRHEDIVLLAEYFLNHFKIKFGKNIAGFQPAVLEALIKYSWPGNVRELENVIERAITLESGKKISLTSLPQSILSSESILEKKDIAPPVSNEIRIAVPNFSKGPLKLDEILGGIEQIFVRAAIKQVGGVKKSAADLLTITFRSLRYRVKKMGEES